MKYFAGAVLATVLIATSVSAQSLESGKFMGLFSAVPLMDLGSKTYKGFQGGLYQGNNTIPTAQATAGSGFASQVQPLDTSGRPSSRGKIVFTSIGMSNAAVEFGAFSQIAAANSRVNHTTLAIENGALGGITACYWIVPFGSPPCSLHTENQFDRVRDNVLTPAGLSEKQVQIVWINEANGAPGVIGCGAGGNLPCNPLCSVGSFGCVNSTEKTEALRYEQQVGEIIRAAKVRWPNLKLAFLSTRIYAGYAVVNINPEPYAYEYGFSAKWLIQAQITQMQTGVMDPVAGNLNFNNGTAPWITWGSYTWADGPVPRSDNFIWCDGQPGSPCNGEVDFQTDGTHPNGGGSKKVGTLLMNFFLSSPYTVNWFTAANRTP
jgi:hypothetical protein